ncbi:tetraspanin-8-like [Mercurialis annua]|uniref:tetraspanin-8-like n=1 Tax=Mercurialis annua TaxID=3986 RepID=UPI0024AE5E25|nr:tetraspanin-8-like [Mercurialis annua]
MLIVGQITTTWAPMHDISVPCANFLTMPVFLLGVALLIVSVVGLIAVLCRVLILHRVYLFVMLLIITALFTFILFSFIITIKGPKMENSSGREYRLNDFSDWLQKHFVGVRDWLGIHCCLVDEDVCDSFGNKLSVLPAAAVWEVITPIESGCCRPPPQCGYKLKNVSYWEVPKSGLTSRDDDCITWKNDEDTLCFNCDSCKAGFLLQLRQDLMILNFLNTFFLIYLIIVLLLGFFSLPNQLQSDKLSNI